MCCFFFLMLRRTTIFKRTAHRFPYTTLFRSASARENSVLLSLVDPGDTASAFDHVQPVRQVGAVWPLAMIAQILVVAACVAIATRAGHPALVPQILVEGGLRSEEHTSELQSLMRISYAVFCLKKKQEYTNETDTI